MSDLKSHAATSSQLSLFGDTSASQGLETSALPETSAPADPATVVIAGPTADPDARARAFAVDPNQNVVLEASAGTGKTSVLVSRYINLLKAGVDPANILAMS